MKTFRCNMHGVTLVEDEGNFGMRKRDIRVEGPRIPGNCTLLHLDEPRALRVGEEYDHPVTGRKAMSRCAIDEM